MVTAFGSTRFAKNPVQEDRNVRELIDAGTTAISIFGKSWDLHVSRALGITENEEIVTQQLHLFDCLIAEHRLDLELLGAHDPRADLAISRRRAISFHPNFDNFAGLTTQLAAPPMFVLVALDLAL